MNQTSKLISNDLCEIHAAFTLYVAWYVFQSQPSLPYNYIYIRNWLMHNMYKTC
jgi:hypothetical protein